MTKEVYWDNWVIRTAVNWEDIEFIIKKTGVDVIDMGYKQLVIELLEMNKLLSLISAGCVDLKAVKKQTELFEKLFEYTKGLYLREDRLILKYKLPGLKKQQRDHKRILGILHGTIQDFKGGKIQAVNDFATLLLKAIFNHIKEHDRETWGLESWKVTIDNAKNVMDFEDSFKKMGIRIFDKEHKEFLRDALSLRSKKSVKEITQKLDGLHARAKQHLEKEEGFIRNFHMQNIEHVLADDKLVLDKIQECKEKCLSGEVTSPLEISTQIILKWLVHINEGNYRTICLDTCSDKIFKNAGKLEDIAFLIHRTGVSVIDDAYRNVLETVFELDGLVGETSEKDGVLIKNTLVEDFFDKLMQQVKELFTIEPDILKFESGINKDSNKEHRYHFEEHRKFLQIISSFQANFHKDRIVVSTNIKARLLGFLIMHHNNFDLPVYSED